MCPACGLGSDEGEAHSLTKDVWVCMQCNFLHCDCAVATREAQEVGFRARTADKVHRMLHHSAPSDASEATLSPTPIPPEVLDGLRLSCNQLFTVMSSSGCCGLMLLLLESSASLCIVREGAADGPPASVSVSAPDTSGGQTRPVVQQWIDGWMKSATSRRRFWEMISGTKRFREVVMQIGERKQLQLEDARALMDFSAASDGSSTSTSSSSSLAPSLPFPASILFDLVRRKERRFLSVWLKHDRAYFTALWPRLVDPTTGCSPLLYLVSHARGCRQGVFSLLVRFTCAALRVSPADLLTQRNEAGNTLAEMLGRSQNRDLRGLIEELQDGHKGTE